jgi:hypothetical protein
MGYWINHHVRATGSKEDIEAYVSKLTQRRPKSLNDEGDIVWSEEEFSFYNITPPPEELLMSGEWWGGPGNFWRADNWGCYDAPAEEVDVFTNGYGSSQATIRIDTKYEWPISIFHELISQYPNLQFNIWSEGEEAEAVHIQGTGGTWTQTEYESPNCHADYDARDMLDSCWCNQYEDSSEWYKDCPRDNPGLFKVVVTHTHYITAQSITETMGAIEAYENGFDMPDNTTMIKYNPVPKILITPAEVAE